MATEAAIVGVVGLEIGPVRPLGLITPPLLRLRSCLIWRILCDRHLVKRVWNDGQSHKLTNYHSRSLVITWTAKARTCTGQKIMAGNSTPITTDEEHHLNSTDPWICTLLADAWALSHHLLSNDSIHTWVLQTWPVPKVVRCMLPAFASGSRLAQAGCCSILLKHRIKVWQWCSLNFCCNLCSTYIWDTLDYWH